MAATAAAVAAALTGNPDPVQSCWRASINWAKHQNSAKNWSHQSEKIVGKLTRVTALTIFEFWRLSIHRKRKCCKVTLKRFVKSHYVVNQLFLAYYSHLKLLCKAGSRIWTETHGRSITTAHPLSHSVTPSFDNFSPGGSRATDRISITKSNGILVLFQTWPLWRRITSGFYKTSICNVCVLSLSHPIIVNWRTKKWVPTVNQLWDKDSYLYWDHAVHLFRAPVAKQPKRSSWPRGRNKLTAKLKVTRGKCSKKSSFFS